MVSEELVDACLCVVFDVSVVGIVDRLDELAEVAEAVLVVGEPMADERPSGQLCAVFQSQRAGPSHAAAAHDGGMFGDTLGNLGRQASVAGCEVEPRTYGSCQLNPVTRLGPLTCRSVDDALAARRPAVVTASARAALIVALGARTPSLRRWARWRPRGRHSVQ